MIPLLAISLRCKYPMKLQAEADQNWTWGVVNSSAAFMQKLTIPAEIMEVQEAL
jgi:hypothetical protein